MTLPTTTFTILISTTTLPPAPLYPDTAPLPSQKQTLILTTPTHAILALQLHTFTLPSMKKQCHIETIDTTGYAPQNTKITRKFTRAVIRAIKAERYDIYPRARPSFLFKKSEVNAKKYKASMKQVYG